MIEFIREAGFGVFPTLAFGLAALFVGVRQLRDPERARVPIAGWLIALTVAAGALGTVTGLQASVSFIEQTSDKWLFLIGLRESLNNLVVAFILSILTMLCLLGGQLRLGAPAPSASPSTAPMPDVR